MIKTIWENVINIFLPKCCVLCNKILSNETIHHLCEHCWNKFKPLSGLFCQKCGKPLPDGGAHCYFCRTTGASGTHFEYIRAAGIYEGALKEVIHKFKYQGKDFLVSDLSKFLIQESKDKFDWTEIDFVVPVPLHKESEHRRGYNQAKLLAEKVAEHFNKPLSFTNLIRLRKTKAQMQLPREKRLVNLIDAFAIVNPLEFKGKNILLIDDVSTTGATIEECAKTMKRAGIKKVWALVLAHGA